MVPEDGRAGSEQACRFANSARRAFLRFGLSGQNVNKSDDRQRNQNRFPDHGTSVANNGIRRGEIRERHAS